jgi:hypothetical protein
MVALRCIAAIESVFQRRLKGSLSWGRSPPLDAAIADVHWSKGQKTVFQQPARMVASVNRCVKMVHEVRIDRVMRGGKARR